MKAITYFLLTIIFGTSNSQCSKDGETSDKCTPSILIDNNTVWMDSEGNEIKAQGGCIIQEEQVFHWVGPEFESSDKNFRAINHYTSSDLKKWVKKQPLLTPSGKELETVSVTASSWVGRPWILKCDNNNYVMWLELGKLNGSIYRNRYAVFAASKIGGQWTFVRVYESLADKSGTQRALGDLGTYQDGANAYLLYTFDKNETNGCQAIVKLSSDFRSVSEVVAEFPKSGYYCKEAASMFKMGQTYYYFMSETRGWKPSKTWYRTASSVGTESQWSDLKEVKTSPPSDTYSFNTQHDFVLPVKGNKGTTYIYCGDRWSLYSAASYNGAVGRQAWFPLQFNVSGEPTIYAPAFTTNGGDWNLDLTSGKYAEP